MTSNPTSKARAVLSDVTVSFGLLAFSVDVVPAQRSKSAKSADKVTLTSVCPTCTDAEPLKQELYCGRRHGPFSLSEADKALLVNGALRKVDPDAVAEVKNVGVERGAIALSACRAEQVEAATMPSGSIYRLRPRKPTKAAEQAYALVLELLRDTEVAFICEMTLKTATKMYRAIGRDGMITMTELVRPEEFYSADPVLAQCDPRLVETGAVLVSQLLDDFDPAAWQDRSKVKLAELRERIFELAPVGPTVVAVPDRAAESADDLLAALQQAVTQAA